MTNKSSTSTSQTKPAGRLGRRLRQSALAAVVGGTALASLSGLGAAPAFASAYGCTGYGSGISWQGLYVKNGTFCGGIVGSGTYVQGINGNFYTHLPFNAICNWDVKADFYNVYGQWYTWRRTGIVYNCSLASDAPYIPINQWMNAGYVRITLESNGGYVASITESIR